MSTAPAAPPDALAVEVEQAVSASFSQAAKLEQARLVLLEGQVKLRQPFLEVIEHLPGICCALKAHHEVVGVAHDRDQSTRMSATPLMDPEIEDAMQEGGVWQLSGIYGMPAGSWLRARPCLF